MTSSHPSRWRTFLKRGALIALILVVVLFFGARFYMYSARPPHTGTLLVEGIDAAVKIDRDAYSIPYIEAQSEEDALFALGYTHAQERLWQMEFFRRIADGRLAEIFGSSLVDTDKFMRTVGMGRAAEADERELDEDSRKKVNAYVAGVNWWLKHRTGALPPEFLILQLEPEPWTARNSLSVAKIIAADLASWGTDLENQRALDKFGKEKAGTLQAPYPDFGPTILGNALAPSTPHQPTPPTPANVELPAIPPLAMELMESVSMVRASNAWVIGGKLTKSGKPIVANDPHLTLRAPSLWFLVSIHGGDLHRAGVTIPGIPAVILGTAPTFAWGFTNAMVDDVDFYIERLEGDSYATPEGMKPLVKRTEVIKVRGAADVTHVVRTTRHGPIFTDLEDKPPKNVLAMRWSAVEPAHGIIALLGMGRATDWQSFLKASERWDTAHQNMVFGANDGTFGYTLLGKIPVRKAGDGSYPVPGDTDEYEWTSFITGADMPRALNVEEGFIVTANNKHYRSGGPMVTRDYPTPFRSMRIRELLLSGKDFTVADVAKQQMDLFDSFATRYIGRAIAAADTAGLSEAKQLLSTWKLEVLPDSKAAALFYVWVDMLKERFARDDWGDDTIYFPRLVLVDAFERNASPWADNIKTPEVETVESISADAMKDAVALVAGRTWGEVHTTLMEHPLGKVDALNSLFHFHVGPVARGGSPYTVNVAPYAASKPPYVNKDGASHRHVVDVADIEGTGGFSIPTGESGLPFDTHYRDLNEKWLKGELVHIPVTPGAPHDTVEAMVLKPAANP